MFGATPDAGGKLVAVELERRCQLAHHARDDRPDPERLLDHGVEILVALAGVDLGLQTLELARVPQQQVERPRERRRGRLVPGDEQGDQLVAQLDVGHRPALLVARLEQDREHVVALGDVVGPAGAGAISS